MSASTAGSGLQVYSPGFRVAGSKREAPFARAFFRQDKPVPRAEGGVPLGGVLKGASRWAPHRDGQDGGLCPLKHERIFLGRSQGEDAFWN